MKVEVMPKAIVTVVTVEMMDDVDQGKRNVKVNVKMMIEGATRIRVRLTLVRATRIGRGGMVSKGCADPSIRIAAERDASGTRLASTEGASRAVTTAFETS